MLSTLAVLALIGGASAAIDSAFDRREGGGRYLGLSRADEPGSECFVKGKKKRKKKKKKKKNNFIYLLALPTSIFDSSW
jgi:hypothetical protein